MTQIDVPALAAELANVQEQKKRWEDRERQIKAILRGLGIGKHPAGNLGISVTPNRRVDSVKVEAAYPVSDFPHFYKQVPNLEIVKNNVAPAMYEALMSEVGEPTVKVS